jgi:tetratricopeptide (TPR) repeat protein
MNNLANSSHSAGRRTEALKLREEVLTLSRKVNGPEHADTLMAMGNLADSYAAAARPDEALKLREDLLRLSRKVNGPEHPDNVRAMGYLAESYAAVGRRDEALRLREEVLTLSRKMGGLEHPDTLEAMSHLANSYDAAGRRAEALKLREEVLTLSRKVNGPEHPDSVTGMGNLAESYAVAGRLDEALKLQEEALRIIRKVYGPEHPDNVTAMGDLAESYAAAGRLDEALKLREEVLTLSRKASGPEHPNTLRAMGQLAESYAVAGRGDEALGLTLEALALSLQKDLNSPASAAAYAELGFSLGAAGHDDDAIQAWQEALRIDPGGTAEAHYWLGIALADHHRYFEALPILRASRKFYPDGERGREVTERLALAESLAPTEKPPTRTPSRQSVATWLADIRQWVAAGPADRVKGLRLAVAANPADKDKAEHLAIVHLWLGETNEHQAICQKLLKDAANSRDPVAHDGAAEAYLLQAHPEPDLLKQAVAAGRQALKLAATNNTYRGRLLVTAGLAAIRDGVPGEAEPLLTEVLNVPGAKRECRGLALACQVMARARLGRTNEARADFADLQKIRAQVPAPPTVSPIVFDRDAMAVALVYEEAKELLNLPGTGKP